MRLSVYALAFNAQGHIFLGSALGAFLSTNNGVD
jgi:hypothetical protein